MTLNYLDLIIGLPIVLFAIGGYRKGFIKELTSLMALLLGIYFALYFSDVVAEWLIQYFDIGHRYVFIVAFILTFIAVVLLVSLIGKLLDKIASLAALGIVNKLLGLAFGVLKAGVIMSILILLFNMIDSNGNILKSELKDTSLLYRPVESIAPLILMNIDSIDFDDPSWDDFKKNTKDKKLDQVV